MPKQLVRAALFLVALAAWTQQTTLVIRSNTRLVEMTVVVQDRKGAPVTGLRKEDFRITDDGKPQEIAVFEAHDGEKVAAATGTLPAGFFTNRLEYRGGAPSSATVVLIDLINTPPGYWGRAKPHLTKFLQQADGRLRIAIYSLNRSGLRVLHEFTRDASMLTRRLTGVAESQALEISPEMQAFLASIGDPAGARAAILGSGSGSAAVAELVARSAEQESAFYAPLDSVQTAEALAAIAQRLSGVPGRKNLIWITTGFARLQPGSIGRVSAAFDWAAHSLSNASVAVYPIDARGLLAHTDDLRVIEPNRATYGRASTQAVRFETGPLPGTITMGELAARTGGRVFHGEEIDEAMPVVFQHARSFYTLAYYPAGRSPDGTFRQIAVKVRRGGAKVSHRAGYYSLPQADLSEDQRKSELMSAVWSPVDATAVGLDAALETDPANGADARRLVLSIDGRALQFVSRGDKMVCRMDLLLVQKNAEGKQIDGVLDTFESSTTPQTMEALVKNGLVHKKELRLKPEAAILRVVVRNRDGGLGSLSIPLKAGL